MNKSIIIASIFYLIGIIIGLYFKKYMLFFYILFFVFIFIIRRKNRIIKILISKKYLIMITIFILLGNIYTLVKEKEYSRFYELVNSNDEVILFGKVISNRVEKEYNNSYIIKIKSIEINNKKYNFIFDKICMVNIKKDKENENSIQYLDNIYLKGTYLKPTNLRNYKGFDYREYLKSKNSIGTIKSEKFEVIKNKYKKISILYYINEIKLHCINNINKNMSVNSANIIFAFIFGEKENMEKNELSYFENAEVSHMLAVSGTHVTYLIVLTDIIFKNIKINIKTKRKILIVILIIFIFITNSSISVLRACIMGIMTICASLLHRKNNIYNNLAFSNIFILIINPYNILNLGFIFSYLGTIGILIFSDDVKKLVEKMKLKYKIFKFIIETVLVTLSANSMIIPIIIYKYKKLNLIFILSNLILSPFLGIIMIMGLIVVVISIIINPIQISILKILEVVIGIFLFLVKIISKIQFFNYRILHINIFDLFIYYCALCILKMWIIIRKKQDKEGFNNYDLNIIEKKYIEKIKLIKKWMIIIIVFIFMFKETVILINNIDQDLNIYFIDVGQGDSTLIQSKGKNVLIDAGGNMKSDYDIGEKVLYPYLNARNIRCLDYVIISHFDADHCNGLNYIIEKIKIKNLIISEQASISEEYKKIIKKCINKKVNIIKVKSNDFIKITSKLVFEILHPQDKFMDDGKGGLNVNSIVAKLRYKNKKEEFTMLFTGDIEVEAEKYLVDNYKEKIKSDFIKIAHHGSKTSSTEEFLDAVNGKVALIGVGDNNKFGHPNASVLDRLNKKYKIYRTDKNGEIIIKVKNYTGKINIKTKY